MDLLDLLESLDISLENMDWDQFSDDDMDVISYSERKDHPMSGYGGSFEACDSMDKIFRIVDQIFSEVTVPILAGFEIGHGRTNIIVPIGLEATLNTDRQSLFFHEPATRGDGDA